MNVEIVATVGGIKYLFKYIHKVSDQIMVETLTGSLVENEVQSYVNARYLSSNEAHWRTSGFGVSSMHPSVQKLALHFPFEQCVTYKDNDNLTDGQLRDEITNALTKAEKTQLTEFFTLCRNDPKARDLVYPDVFRHYTWQTTPNKLFQARKRNMLDELSEDGSKSNTIGRIPVVALGPHSQERFFFETAFILC